MASRGQTALSSETPWYVPIIGNGCGVGEHCDNLDQFVATLNAHGAYFPNPRAAVQFVAAVSGGTVRQYGSSRPKEYGAEIVLPEGSCSCTFPPYGPTIGVTVLYAGFNFGKVCPDESYVEGNKPCSCLCLPDGRDLGDPCSHPGGCAVGHPINLATGNMFEAREDFRTAGDNPLNFTRYYNSLANATNAPGMLGMYWRSTYERSLKLSTGASGLLSAVATRADGQEFSFNEVLNNSPDASLFKTRWLGDSDIDATFVPVGSEWALNLHDDTVERYDSVGRLLWIRARNGYTQTMQYDTGGRLTNVVDSFGRALSFSYESGLLHSMTVPDGRVFTYGYESGPGGSRLTSVEYPTKTPTRQRFLYENASFPYALTGVIDENGKRFTSWTYDAVGRAVTSESADGVDLTAVSYNDADGSCLVTDALGLVTKYEFYVDHGVRKVLGVTRLESATTATARIPQNYDPNGFTAGHPDWNGNNTIMENDSHGQPVTITEAAGTLEARITTINYLTNFHLPMQVAAPLKSTAYSYDDRGNAVSVVETDNSTATTPYPVAGQSRAWTNSFDGFGHLLSMTGPRTDVVATASFGYVSNYLAAVTNALGQVTQFPEYNGSGLPTQSVDANGVATTFTYDERDRLLTRTVHATTGDAVTRMSYDAAGNLTSLTLPDGSFLNYQYDSAHRLTSISNVLGEAIHYSLDAAGNATNQTITDASGAVVAIRQRLTDALGRTLREIGAAGQTTTFVYDNNGNPISVRDGLTNETVKTWDHLNQFQIVTDPLHNVTQLTRNAQDKLTQVLDPRNLFTQYTYDGFGRLIQEQSPDKGTTVYELDAAGNRIKETDARGVVTLREFDALNRVTAEKYPGSPSEDISYSYDSTNGGNYEIGRLTGSSDETGQTALVYNERADLVASKRRIDSDNYITGYEYDLADRVIKVSYPSGDAVVYGRDSQGRIASVRLERPSGPAQVLATNIDYLPFGPLKSLHYGNGLLRTMNYDQDYRLTNIVTEGSTKIQDLLLIYDAANDIVSIEDRLQTIFSQTFGYDANQRLIDAAGVYGSIKYGYDRDGNRQSRAVGDLFESYSYLASGNALQSVTTPQSTTLFAYSANGNMIIQTNSLDGVSLQLEYNHRNRYSTLTNGSTIAHYRYSAFGERLVKEVNGAVTHFHYDQQHRLLAETNPGRALIRAYVWVDDLPLAQIESDGSIYYISPDHLNTPEKMTDQVQALVWERHQQPFGEDVPITSIGEVKIDTTGHFTMEVQSLTTLAYTIQTTTNLVDGPWLAVGTNKGSALFKDEKLLDTKRFYPLVFALSLKAESYSFAQNLRFPGQYHDTESPLFYGGMRNYYPEIAKFSQCDPAGLNGEANTSNYALNNPINYIDPSGTISLKGLYEAYEGYDNVKHVGEAAEDAGRIATECQGTGAPAPKLDSGYPDAEYVKNLQDFTSKHLNCGKAVDMGVMRQYPVPIPP